MAKDSAVVTEEELEEMLREDPDFAFKMIDADYGQNIARYIASFCRSFDEDDVYEAYKGTLKDFIRCTKKSDFEPKSPLKLIFHIAKLRALARRRDKRLSPPPELDELFDTIAEDQRNTTTRINWQLIKSQWPEFRVLLDKLIQELPLKQRDAMSAFVETYWEIRTQGSKQKLAQHIRQQYGYDCTASEASLHGFCIYHAEPGGWRTEGRVKFSLGHELGHYYLPAHRERLLNGDVHNSKSDFSSRNPIELEADEFAADLLMPMPLFLIELNRFRNGFCDLDDLGTLAERLGTSLISTARRYCESDREPCTIFFSTNGVMHWGIASEDMKRLGMYWYDSGKPPPAGSKTAEIWFAMADGRGTKAVGGRVAADVWFAWPKANYLWEEAKPLGTNRVITQFTPDD